MESLRAYRDNSRPQVSLSRKLFPIEFSETAFDTEKRGRPGFPERLVSGCRINLSNGCN
jgi:hypothetical protein